MVCSESYFAKVRYAAALAMVVAFHAAGFDLTNEAYHVFPGDDLQMVLDLASTNKVIKVVKVHEGTYAPERPSQALIYFNRRHDGIHLLGLGRPVLTAANPKIANPSSPSYPAIVNHVIYFGDGISSNTLLEDFRLTGAKHFVTNCFQKQMEPDATLPKGRFYYGDGGAIKVYHRSYPVLRDLEIIDNYASPCAGGISIQQEGECQQFVVIENCVFRNNRSEVTGAALDLLWGSSARVVNCLFAGNVSNTGPGEGQNPFTNNGAITVFPRSKVVMEACTLTANRNGIDDMSGLSEYTRTLFFANQLEAGMPGQSRYELDLQRGATVLGCVSNGQVRDPRGSIGSTNNLLYASNLELNEDCVPIGTNFAAIGYRPSESARSAARRSGAE